MRQEPICIGCGCNEQHACDLKYFNGLVECGIGCWWVRFNADAKIGVCSACWDLVKAWDTGKSLAPIWPLIAERFYRQAMFLYEDQSSALAWMAAPHPLLGGRSPRELILAGELERVRDVLAQLRDGAYV